VPVRTRLRTAAALELTRALALNQRLGEAVEVCDGVAARLDPQDVEAHLVLEALAVMCGLLDAAVAPSVVDRRWSPPRAGHRGIRAAPRTGYSCPSGGVGQQARRRSGRLGAPGGTRGAPRALPELGEPPWFELTMNGLMHAECWNEAQGLLDGPQWPRRGAAADGLVLNMVLADRATLGLRRNDLTAAEADGAAPSWRLRACPLACLPRLLATGILVGRHGRAGATWTRPSHALERVAADPPEHVPVSQRSCATPGDVSGLPSGASVRRLNDFPGGWRHRHPHPGGQPRPTCPGRSDAALVELSLGNHDGARRLSEEELELARAFGAPPRPRRRPTGPAGLVAGVQRGEGAFCARAIEVLAGPDNRLEQARAPGRPGRGPAPEQPPRRGAPHAAPSSRRGASRRCRTARPPGRDGVACHRGQAAASHASPGWRLSLPASAVSPSSPLKGSQTLRSPRPCSLRLAPSRATSPTSSKSSMSAHATELLGGPGRPHPSGARRDP